MFSQEAEKNEEMLEFLDSFEQHKINEDKKILFLFNFTILYQPSWNCLDLNGTLRKHMALFLVTEH